MASAWMASTGMTIIENSACKEVATLDPDCTEAPTKSPTKARRNKTVVQPWQICSKKDIEPYNKLKYKVLYGERKFAQEFAKQKQTLSFTDDLPTEVRLRIYDFLFSTHDGYFELWAPHENTFGEKKWQNLFRKYASNRKALRIMRVSKRIHEEVADYFYGRLNFRFSNSDGFQAMAIFNNTIRPLNYNFIKHITVRIPSGYLGQFSLRGWDRFTDFQERRGMRTPFFKRREEKRSRGTTTAERLYDMTVRRGFSQLGDMAGLKLLEILVPWDYLPPQKMGGYKNWDEPTPAPCVCEDFWYLSPKDMVRHLFEVHSEDSEYWTLLANLKQQSSSDDLTIALVYDYNSLRYAPFQEYADDHEGLRDILRRGRWVAAYAKAMGYKFGYARLAEKGAYQVRYDEDMLMSKSLELLKDDRLEYDPFLEPPELSGDAA